MQESYFKKQNFIMFPLNLWASCFQSINAFESNWATELLPWYHPLPRETALAYPAWQNTAPANFRSSFYVACISLLPRHVFLEDAGGAQHFIPPWHICSSSPAVPPILFPCHSKLLEVYFTSLTLPLPPLSPATSLVFITSHHFLP